MGIPWDGTGINCYGMGQINMSRGQPWLARFKWLGQHALSGLLQMYFSDKARLNRDAIAVPPPTMTSTSKTGESPCCCKMKSLWKNFEEMTSFSKNWIEVCILLVS